MAYLNGHLMTIFCEPRQARKGATVAKDLGVGYGCWGRLPFIDFET